ncbi:unnamed protein product [Bursaphelenchus xylophilus]|uniref:(pine wood nematode) hypothetical protein n=1 Tax=Bursaphelenchus xylophilus TaxID=6326 RepID=A0A7I8WM38_BURXY|nr:unnamed protein product [Bursaphelenchus xylophilus]CAG9104715.1 unnamed protein product [Bursaphelenchus xylophilus]
MNRLFSVDRFISSTDSPISSFPCLSCTWGARAHSETDLNVWAASELFFGDRMGEFGDIMVQIWRQLTFSQLSFSPILAVRFHGTWSYPRCVNSMEFMERERCPLCQLFP